MLYFAYGANMNPQRAAKRMPNAKSVGVGIGILHGWRLEERLYADIEPTEGAETQGELYVITEEQLRKLDRFEGYSSVCRRIWVDVEFEGGIC